MIPAGPSQGCVGPLAYKVVCGKLKTFPRTKMADDEAMKMSMDLFLRLKHIHWEYPSLRTDEVIALTEVEVLAALGGEQREVNRQDTASFRSTIVR